MRNKRIRAVYDEILAMCAESCQFAETAADRNAREYFLGRGRGCFIAADKLREALGLEASVNDELLARYGIMPR